MRTPSNGRRKSNFFRLETLESRRCLTTGFAVSEISCCEAGDVVELAVADINGDSLDDIITSSDDGGGIAWYPKDGTGFGERMSIMEGTSASRLIVADVDGDLDNDVIAGTNGSDTGSIVWYENLDGAGDFSAAKSITATPRGNFSIQFADIDKDNDLDLVWGATNADSIAWHPNDGSGSFASPRLIWANFDRVTDVKVADMDGDGNLDVLAASFSLVNPKVSWFRNDGAGNFLEEMPVISRSGSPWSIDAGDVDGDGDLDVVVSSYQGGGGVALKATNDGTGVFSNAETIDSVAALANIELVDLDGDTMEDLVATTSVGRQSGKWYRNLGDGTLDIARNLPVQTLGLTAVAFADLNADGRIDIVSNAEETGRLLQQISRVMGDSTGDGVFDSSDIVAAFVAGAYEAETPATFDQGDWNGDGVFDTSDLVTAFQAGTYVQGAVPISLLDVAAALED